LSEYFTKDNKSYIKSLHDLQKIIFGPVAFQACKILLKNGILSTIFETRDEGISFDELLEKCDFSRYGLQVLLEAGMAIEIILKMGDKYLLSKLGYALLNDKMGLVHLDFMDKLCYEGFADLEDSIKKGKPEGLKKLGNWDTIYEGLAHLEPEARDSWLAFDHYHSDGAFEDALKVVFKNSPKSILDIGANTGRWTKQCLEYSETVRLGLVDLPGQLAMAKKTLTEDGLIDRTEFHPRNMLDTSVVLPEGYDIIWMSQFLACFADDEITSILAKVKEAMDEKSVLYINEPCWDRQKMQAGAYSLIMVSLYFTCFANGNSKSFNSLDLERNIETAGLKLKKIHDIGTGHSLFECRLK
jgi:O-methyltransferase domain